MPNCPAFRSLRRSGVPDLREGRRVDSSRARSLARNHGALSITAAVAILPPVFLWMRGKTGVLNQLGGDED